MINFSKIWNLTFWTTIHPPAMSGEFAFRLAVIFALMLAGAAAARHRYRALKRQDRFMSYVWRKLASMLLFTGILGEVLVFFAYEGAPFFSMRLWFLAWFIGALAWGASILFYRFKKLPELLSANHEAAVRKV